MVTYEYPFKQGSGRRFQSECILALGFFDGVHIAHRDLLACAKDIAKQKGFPFGVFTFKSDGGIKKNAQRLYGDEEKSELFKRLGVDFAVFADFESVSVKSPEQFVLETLRGDLNCVICVAGFNFRFGKGASASAAELEELMEKAGGRAVIRQEIKQDGRTVSTSFIRELLAEGRIREANALLGSPYFIGGEVTHGNSKGRKIGFPTINIALDENNVHMARGVYRCAVPIDGRIYTGITNIGSCPTFGEREVHAETHILGFKGDLYGKRLDVYFLDYMREEKLFSSPDELKMQINIDKNKAIKENGDLTWQALGLK